MRLIFFQFGLFLLKIEAYLRHTLSTLLFLCDPLHRDTPYKDMFRDHLSQDDTFKIHSLDFALIRIHIFMDRSDT
jgi:hypothetical protein